MADVHDNRQVRKTRKAILDAFRDLVLSRPYSDIHVRDIISGADVGRSTFYEHFRSKDDLLRESLSGIIGVMADTVLEECDRRHLTCLMDHFRENHRMARTMLSGPLYPQVVRALGALIKERLEEWAKDSGLSCLLPLDLAAVQIASGHFGLVREWLQHDCCSSEALAIALERSGRAIAVSLFEMK